jgi:hypothetical protein
MGVWTRDLPYMSTRGKRNRSRKKPLSAKPGGAKAFTKRYLRRQERHGQIAAVCEDWGDMLDPTPRLMPEPGKAFVYERDLIW